MCRTLSHGLPGCKYPSTRRHRRVMFTHCGHCSQTGLALCTSVLRTTPVQLQQRTCRACHNGVSGQTAGDAHRCAGGVQAFTSGQGPPPPTPRHVVGAGVGDGQGDGSSPARWLAAWTCACSMAHTLVGVLQRYFWVLRACATAAIMGMFVFAISHRLLVWPVQGPYETALQ